MVISVFNTAPGFQAYQGSRRARLQDQALRTQNTMMQRRQDAFQDMVAGLEDPQQRAMAEAMGLDYVPFAIEQDAAQRAAQAESAAAARERADAFMSEVYRPALEQAAPQFFQAQTPEERLAIAVPLSRRLNIESQRVGGRGELTPEALIAELEGYVGAGQAGRDYNLQFEEFATPSGAIVRAETDPRAAPGTPPLLTYLDGSPFEGNPRSLTRVQSRTVDETPPPPTGGTGEEDFDAEVFFFGNELQNAYQSAMESDPNDFGITGFARGLARDVGQQVLAARGLTFDELAAVARAETDEDANADAVSEFFDLSGYDGDSRQLERDARLLAYQAASVIARQTGRGLSDRDLQQFRDALGDPMRWDGNKPAYLQSLEDFDRRTISRLNAERRARRMPPLPEGVSFIDGSFEQYARSPDEFRAAPPPPRRPRREQEPQQELLTRDDFDSQQEYDRYLDQRY